MRPDVDVLGERSDLYAVSLLARKGQQVEHSVAVGFWDNPVFAEESALLLCFREYPQAQGYSGHSVNVFALPASLLREAWFRREETRRARRVPPTPEAIQAERERAAQLLFEDVMRKRRQREGQRDAR